MYFRQDRNAFAWPQYWYYSDVIKGPMASQITSLTIVCSTVYSGADQKKNIKAPRHWPLWGESTGDRLIPRTNGQWRGKCFHLMTSSWRWRRYNGIPSSWKRRACLFWLSIPWLLMTRWRKEPGHQQPWYWPSHVGAFEFHPQNG